MKKLLCTLEGAEVWQDDDLKVWFTADADVDADGANGQNGAQPAYTVRNDGSEDLANGGMKLEDGKPVFANDWGHDIVLWDVDFKPRVFPGGIIASKTAYHWPEVWTDDPAAYVDAETVPYVVVSPLIRQKAKGVILGCRAAVTNTRNGRAVNAVVADIGPRNKVGELSIAAARAIGINPNPRTGGEDEKVIKYELFPGTPAVVNGTTYALIKA